MRVAGAGAIEALVRVVLGLLLAASLANGAAAEPITVTARPILLDPGDPTRTTVGQLEFRGGVRMTSTDPRFGGLSDLSISADGTRMLTISDHGAWVSARLEWDGGMLRGVSTAELIPMLDAKGVPLVPPNADAEAMITTPAGRIVTFERQHRLWLYPGEWPFAAPPQTLPAPQGLAKSPANGGLEAAVALSDGRLVLFAEQLKVAGGLAAWVQGTDGAFAPFTFVPVPGFEPSSAARLPDGDVLVLQRRFNLFDRTARIVRIAAAEFQPGAMLTGAEVATINSPLNLDNMEGIAAIRASDGGVLVFLISDDNFKVLERTLLMVFRLGGP